MQANAIEQTHVNRTQINASVRVQKHSPLKQSDHSIQYIILISVKICPVAFDCIILCLGSNKNLFTCGVVITIT